MFRRILVSDPDPAVACQLAAHLSAAGHAARCSHAVAVESRCGDLILLDPGADCEIVEELKRGAMAPMVVVHSASADPDFRLEALQRGADDYWTKPLPVAEMVARLAAWRRRVEGVLEIGSCRIHFARAVIEREGTSHALSMKEFLLLRYLADHPGVTLAREELLREALGFQSTLTRTLDMHVSNLRRKMEIDPARPRHIVTVAGVGYRFSPSGK